MPTACKAILHEQFYTSRRYTSAVYAMALCLSVRPSVRRLSQVGIISIRLNMGSFKQHRTIAQCI